MRFLDMHFNTPDNRNLKIDFSEGVNILSISDDNLFLFIKQNPLCGLCCPVHGEIRGDADFMPYSINISADTLHGSISFINDRGNFSIKENTGDHGSNAGYPGTVQLYEDYNSRYAVHELNLISLFDPELIRDRKDPVFNTEVIKSFLINNETDKYDSVFFSGIYDILKEKEKERTDFNREKQLLELKLNKREKLLKEVQNSERELNRLEIRRDSILKYKSVINEIKTKTEERSKLSAKINNMKQNLIEYREIQLKADLIETKLKNQFPLFFQKSSDQLPDLGNIQELFNKYRDINEQIDGFFIKKRRFSGILVKIIQSVSFFSLISALFILFKPETLPVLGMISGLTAIAAILLILIAFFKIRDLRPSELLERKKHIESDLIEIIKKNQFHLDSNRTGEVYELLFQYFTDYIRFKDLNSELEELKKKIPDSISLREKDKNLDKLILNYEDIGDRIKEMSDSLDESVHARPSEDGMREIIYDLDEMLEENAKDISQKKDLLLKFVNEIAEHDKTENSSASVENTLDQVIKKIDECDNIIKHINFLTKVLKDASDAWTSQKMETLVRLSSGHFLKLTNSSFQDSELSDLFENFILNSGMVKNEYMDYIHSISLSVKTALYEMLSGEEFPPFFIIDPFSLDNDFTGNLKKLLPELFPGRQVIIIIPEGAEKPEGNQITI